MKFKPLALALLSFSCAAHAAPPAGYHIVFDEEFRAPLSVSNWGSPKSKWMAHTPYAGDFGDAWFTGPNEPNTPSPFSARNGTLTIRAWKDATRANHWRSGLLSSVDTHGNGFSQALGYWECKMSLPKGAGVWPAFWMNGITSCNRKRATNCVEIDILEAYGVDMTIAHQHVHIWNPQGKDVGGASHQIRGNYTNRAHIYGCLVTPSTIVFSIDGYVIWTTPTPKEALEPLYCMVNLALGGGWPIIATPNPSQMYVNYVRCYAKNL